MGLTSDGDFEALAKTKTSVAIDCLGRYLAVLHSSALSLLAA